MQIPEVLSLMLMWLAVVYFHEGGHYLAAKILRFKNVKLNFHMKLYPHQCVTTLPYEEYLEYSYRNLRLQLITITGPLLGVIPLIFYTYGYVDNLRAVLLLSVGYLLMCSADLIKVLKRIYTGVYHAWMPENLDDCMTLKCANCKLRNDSVNCYNVEKMRRS
jgi:hypothetical protein